MFGSGGPFVRVAHWTIVIAFALAYATEDDLLSPHVWAGYVTGLVVLLRLTWERNQQAFLLYVPNVCQ